MLVDTVTRGKRVRRRGKHTALRFECHDCTEFLLRQQPGACWNLVHVDPASSASSNPASSDAQVLCSSTAV
jgi:hypothetical protein